MFLKLKIGTNRLYFKNMTNLVFKYLFVTKGNITEYFKLLEIQPDAHAYPTFGIFLHSER